MTIASSISVSTVLFGLLGPIGRSEVEERLRHFGTVLAFRPYRVAKARVLSCDAWSSARTRGVVRGAREDLLPKCIIPLTAQGCTITLRD